MSRETYRLQVLRYDHYEEYLLVDGHHVAVEVDGIVHEQVVNVVGLEELFKVSHKVVEGANGGSSCVETVTWGIISVLETDDPTEEEVGDEFGVNEDIWVDIGVEWVDVVGSNSPVLLDVVLVQLLSAGIVQTD